MKKNNSAEYAEVLNSFQSNSTTGSHLSLKKARIPFRICLKLAFKNIWKKKFSYLIMLVVSTISLAFLSFTIELNGDPLRQNIFTMIENGYRYTEIKQYVPIYNPNSNDPYIAYNYGDLQPNSYDTIKTEIPELTVHKYENVEILFSGKLIENKNFFYTGVIDTIILYDETNTYNLLCGRTPNLGTQEILITDYLISAMQYFDMIPVLTSYSDYLGMYLNLNWFSNYKVVGIIDTNYEKWTKFARLSTIDETNKDNYSYINDFKMMNAVVLNNDYFEVEKNALGNYTSIRNMNIDISFNNLLNGQTYTMEPNEINIIGTTAGESFALAIPRPWEQDVPLTVPQYPTSENEIVLPMSLIEECFNFTYNDYGWSRYQYYNYWQNYIVNKPITLSFTSFDGLKSYEKEYTIVGISDDTTGYILANSEVASIQNSLLSNQENIMVELPNDPSYALQLFNKALNCQNIEKEIPGYVLNVWIYRNDIDTYEVDPFINIISKGGLFVFTVFTIGIMWTIISIEIVDSKKEIGILRSIGLSGSKVSLIFIIQTLFVNLIAYGIAIAIASRIIPLYNSTITDSLGKITLYMYTFTYRSPVYLLIFVVVVTLLSTILPLLKIMSQRIIDVINEREK